VKDQQPDTPNDDTMEMVNSHIDSLILGGLEYEELGQSNEVLAHDP